MPMQDNHDDCDHDNGYCYYDGLDGPIENYNF
jgi:hypothetical protein